MSRWEPGAADRLVSAALQLFGDRGYEATTVAQIAEQAGLNKRTFFRHFADKREILFSGEDALRRSLTDAIRAAPTGASPMEALRSASTAFGAEMHEERRAFTARRLAVIAGNAELRERDLLKRAALTEAMAEALRERGIGEPTASLAANLGTLAFDAAYLRWTDPVNRSTFPELVATMFDDLIAANAVLR